MVIGLVALEKTLSDEDIELLVDGLSVPNLSLCLWHKGSLNSQVIRLASDRDIPYSVVSPNNSSSKEAYKEFADTCDIVFTFEDSSVAYASLQHSVLNSGKKWVILE